MEHRHPRARCSLPCHCSESKGISFVCCCGCWLLVVVVVVVVVVVAVVVVVFQVVI